VIKGLHHNAYRCRDSEETRRFYEDFLGLPLAHTLEINETLSGRRTETLHTFYRLGDGSFLAFFEAPDMDFEFKAQHDYDLHIALEVDQATLDKKFAEGKARGVETRGVSNHGFIHSIYFRDPSGYVIELTTKQPDHERAMDPALNNARGKLDRWQSAKQQVK
jgi:catechol 2,3-dioxygenase-like lactoylglutathione lyase family enzyme